MFKLWPWLEANKNRLLGSVAAVVVAVGLYYFVSWRHDQNEINAGEALTQMLVASPSLTPEQSAEALGKLAADHAGTAAAQRAQLSAAAGWFNVGRYADAQTQFQKALDANATGPLAATAALLHGYAGERASQGGPIAALDVAEALPTTVAAIL